MSACEVRDVTSPLSLPRPLGAHAPTLLRACAAVAVLCALLAQVAVSVLLPRDRAEAAQPKNPNVPRAVPSASEGPHC
jgi:hypothetical protein